MTYSLLLRLWASNCVVHLDLAISGSLALGATHFTLCLLFVILLLPQSAMLLPEILAVAHFDSRIASEAPEPARCRVFVTGAEVSRLRLRHGSSSGGVVRVRGIGRGGRGGRTIRIVCGRRGGLQGAVGRGRRSGAVKYFLVGWQQVVWY